MIYPKNFAEQMSDDLGKNLVPERGPEKNRRNQGYLILSRPWLLDKHRYAMHSHQFMRGNVFSLRGSLGLTVSLRTADHSVMRSWRVGLQDFHLRRRTTWTINLIPCPVQVPVRPTGAHHRASIILYSCMHFLLGSSLTYVRVLLLRALTVEFISLV